MKYHEAVKAVKEGKKVRNMMWPCDSYMYLNEMGKFTLVSDFVSVLCCPFDSCRDSEWEIYEEKKFMSFDQILEGLKLGKTYKRIGLEGDSHIYSNDSGAILIYKDKHGVVEPYEFNMMDFEENYWSEYGIDPLEA